MQSTEPSLDLHVLGLIANKRRRVWLIVSSLTLVVSLVYALFIAPQAYASRISVAFPQSASTGVLGALVGVGGGGNNKYVGIVKSARLAREVEQKAGIQEVLGLPNKGEAVQTLRDGLSVDDNPRDGLMYITVQIPGPPKFATGQAKQRERVKETVTIAAAAYGDALRRYLAYSDVDKESILLRVSEERLRKERDNYDRAVAGLIGFVKRSTNPDAAASTGSVGGGGGGARPPQFAVLEQLYTRRAQLEADIRSSLAELQVGDEQLRDLLRNLDSVPLEDPLLAQTRNALRDREVELQNLEVQYGPDHPTVVAARQQTKILRNQFERQRKAAMSGMSSTRAAAQARLSALQAALNVVMTNISKAERKAHIASESTADYQVLHNNVEIALETLKATASNVAVLQLQTLSAKNRMQVVDDARPPKTGSPGLIMILAECLVLAAVVTAGLIGLDYMRFSRSLPALGVARSEVTA